MNEDMIAIINLNQNIYTSKQLKYFLSEFQIPMLNMFDSVSKTDFIQFNPNWNFISNSFFQLIKTFKWNDILFIYENSNGLYKNKN